MKKSFESGLITVAQLPSDFLPYKGPAGFCKALARISSVEGCGGFDEELYLIVAKFLSIQFLFLLPLPILVVSVASVDKEP